MSIPAPIFLGIVTQINPKWQDFIPVATHAANLKDPVKQSEDRERRQAEQLAEIQNYPVGGQVIKVVVLHAEGHVLYEINRHNAGAAFALWLMKTYPDGPPLELEPAWAYGLDIRNRMRIIALAAAAHPDGWPLPDLFWYHKTFTPARMLDPYEVLIKKEHEKYLTREGVAKFLGLSIPADIDENALAQAQHVREVALQVGLG